MFKIKTSINTICDSYGSTGSICLIWKNDEIVGYTHTFQEADAICNKNSNFVWDFNSNTNNKNRVKESILTNSELEELPMMTIHDV